MNICNNNIAVQNFERCKKFKDKKFEIVKFKVITISPKIVPVTLGIIL